MNRWLTIRTVHAGLAGLQVLTAGGSLADILGTRTAGFLVLVIGAVQVALAAYQVGGDNPPTIPVAPPPDLSAPTQPMRQVPTLGGTA